MWDTDTGPAYLACLGPVFPPYIPLQWETCGLGRGVVPLEGPARQAAALRCHAWEVRGLGVGLC